MHRFTPGPWEANPLDVPHEDNSVYAPTLRSGQRQLVAIVAEGKDAPFNRSLIAAAPDLLEALEEMVATHDEPAGFDGKWGKALDEAIEIQKVKIDRRLDQARAAIAKARAES